MVGKTGPGVGVAELPTRSVLPGVVPRSVLYGPGVCGPGTIGCQSGVRLGSASGGEAD